MAEIFYDKDRETNCLIHRSEYFAEKRFYVGNHVKLFLKDSRSVEGTISQIKNKTIVLKTSEENPMIIHISFIVDIFR